PRRCWPARIRAFREQRRGTALRAGSAPARIRGGGGPCPSRPGRRRGSVNACIPARHEACATVTTVGILGGGQLARMLALAGAPLGLRALVMDSSADACASQVAPLLQA